MDNSLRARESRASRLERWSFALAFGLAGGIAIVLLVAPTLIVLVTSFTSAYSLKFPPPGYSARWYLALWNDSPEILAAAWLSVEVAALATAIATVLAVACAVALARRREAWARVLDAVFMSPLMLPTLAPGVAAGAFIAFMASFDHVAISLFRSDARSEVLPIRMWHIIEANLDVRAAAASGVLIGAAVVLMLLLERLTGVSRHLR